MKKASVLLEKKVREKGRYALGNTYARALFRGKTYYEKRCYHCREPFLAVRQDVLACHLPPCQAAVSRRLAKGQPLRPFPDAPAELSKSIDFVKWGMEAPPQRKMAMVARFVPLGDDDAEVEYWASRSPIERLEHLEELRREYNTQAQATTMEGMDMEFDENGYLKPKGPIEADLEKVKAVFVDGLHPVRAELWDNFGDYLRRFSKSFTPYVEIWLDGSFISRKAQPKDIDFVVFLDWKLYEWGDSNGNLEKFWTFSLEKERLDAYIVPVYPEGHEKSGLTQEMREKWMEIYGQKPVDGFIHQKGFIKLYPAK